MSERTEVARTVREALQIRAPAPAVWHALVRRERTPRWLGAGATIEAVLGGACAFTDLRGERFEGRVEALEATRRLVARAADGGEIDLRIDRRTAGATLHAVQRLRVAPGEADELAAAKAREWRLALLALRAEVDAPGELGAARAGAWSDAPRESAWRALFERGFVISGRVDQLQRRDRFDLLLAGGLALAGRAVAVEPGAQFVGETDRGEVLALSALRGEGRTLAHAELLASPRPAGELAALAAAWRDALAAAVA